MLVAAGALAVFGWCAVAWSGATLTAGEAAGSVAGLDGARTQPGWVVRPGGTRFAFAQEVRNAGSADVTVTGVTKYPGDPFDVSATYVRPAAGVAGVAPGTVGRPFPVRLRRGQDIYLLLRYRQRQCVPMAAGSSIIFDSVEVRYRLFGIGRTSNISFPDRVTAPADAVARPPAC